MSVTITDKMPQFKRSMESVFNDALREGARDILINAKTKAPHNKGGLRSDTDIRNISHLKWRISFWKEYAGAQEAGQMTVRKNRALTFDGGKTFFTLKKGIYKFRKYTTPSTGKAFLKTAGDDIRLKLDGIFKKHAQRAKVW